MRMCAFLLLLGAVIAAAGLALVASAVSIQQHTFDVSDVTPGTIAVVGGCILIALAFVVRALLRVEHALIARTMVRSPGRVAEGVGSVAAAAQPHEASRIPFPPKPKIAVAQQPAPVPLVVRQAPAGDEAALVAAQPQVLERAAIAPLVEASDASLLPKAPAAEEVHGQPRPAIPVRANGAAHDTVATIATGVRPARQQAQARGSLFDSLWPKTQRGAATAQSETPPAVAIVPTPAPAPPPLQEAAPAEKPAPPHPGPVAVSILKSGVVEGMAYTLYSDGSIEAQLPAGTLRFGSITELRNHIEQNS